MFRLRPCLSLFSTDSSDDSTGSLALVRTVLNYQNVTNDPTCELAQVSTWDNTMSTNTHTAGLSIPNWYWRTWEVLFGVVAACIPTLRPLYKWLVQEYTRLTKESEPSKPTDRGRVAKPFRAYPPKGHSTKFDTDVTREEDILPLQNFEGAIAFENVEREVKERHEDERRSSEVSEFKPGLHIHGDISTHRPGHLKRWDSEAMIGGGHGVEEIEDRI